ncbi:hypothetical protein N4G69_53010 [Streptomyces mirabilis]|uniref:hypothetical protein n=1 Tax=Streptomyces mirabilis TaxID=68239 RepID=UPI0021BF5BA9|nr:hypothetical protein [Streptomyces mirabilis]MCT9114073.1 hypothetical protein [Streptomyces mirabilis]
MPTFTAPDFVIDKNLDTACASVVNEIGRTDGKASLFSEPSTGSVQEGRAGADLLL